MKIARCFVCRTNLAALLFASASALLLPQVLAQSTPIGPNVDECTGGSVDPSGYVFETACMVGNSMDLYATNEVNSYNSSYVPQVDSNTIMDDSQGAFGASSGWIVAQQGGAGGTEAYTSLDTPPSLNDVYRTSFESAYCYDQTGQGGTGYHDGKKDDCTWYYYSDTVVQMQGVVTLPGSEGLAYPKYIVMGVTYAPPGASSNVNYSNTTSIGNTATNSTSFSNALGFTIATSESGGIPSGSTDSEGSVTIGTSTSTTYTQTQNSSSSITLNQSSTFKNQLDGYPTTYPPDGPPNNARPDDYDLIWLWLNPELVFTAYPAAGKTAGFIEWGGYAYDPNDEAGPDIYPVQVGCLNGDFAAADCSTEQGVLNRVWVKNEMSPTTQTPVGVSGCASQAAESPSICPNTQDAYNILAADPLAYNPEGSPYSGFSSSPLPTTTPDGRYTQYDKYPPNPVYYEPEAEPYYTLVQMDTQTQTAGGSNSIQVKIEVSETVAAGFLSIFGQKTTYTESDAVTQTNSWLTSLSQQQTITNAYQVIGSAPPNYVDGEYLLYQDNMYGTFVFVPWQ